jgi:hypothetical protein
MRWLILVAWLSSSACSARSDSPATDLVLRGDVIAKQIQASLAGAKGEFRSDRISPDGKRLPGCFIQLGPALGDRRFEFSLPDRIFDLGFAGEIVYKLQPVRLKTVEVTSGTGEFVISVAFDSSGVALKGIHSQLGDAAIPDIKMDRIRLVVRLKPVVTKSGQITYDQPSVRFTADVDNTFIPRFSVLGQTIDVLDALTNYRKDLCHSIEQQMQKALDDPVRKAALGKKIEEGISGQIMSPGSAIVGLRFLGTDLIVSLRR